MVRYHERHLEQFYSIVIMIYLHEYAIVKIIIKGSYIR